MFLLLPRHIIISRQSTSLILQQQITSLEQRALELTAEGAKVRMALARQVDVTERIQAAADRKAKRLAAMLERSQTDLTAARLALRAQTGRQQGEADPEGEFGGAAEEETDPEAQVRQQRQMQGRRMGGTDVRAIAAVNARSLSVVVAHLIFTVCTISFTGGVDGALFGRHLRRVGAAARRQRRPL